MIMRANTHFCTCCFKRFISAALGSMLTTGLFLILRALSAYRSVLMVSSMLESAGLTQAIIKVWLLPPRESEDKHTYTYIYVYVYRGAVKFYNASLPLWTPAAFLPQINKNLSESCSRSLKMFEFFMVLKVKQAGKKKIPHTTSPTTERHNVVSVESRSGPMWHLMIISAIQIFLEVEWQPQLAVQTLFAECSHSEHSWLKGLIGKGH